MSHRSTNFNSDFESNFISNSLSNPVAGFISDPALCQEELREKARQLESALDDTLLVLSRMIEQKDPYTAGHQLRVSCIASDIAIALHWAPERCDLLRRSALIHDIGKIGIPGELLSKPSPLTDPEFALIRTHAEIGYRIVRDISFFAPLAEIIRQHHERMDGSGYPLGLLGSRILPEARVIAVADVFEAMTSYRPYRPALGTDEALAELSRRELYDAAPADALTALIREQGYRVPNPMND